jgi:hypothetical protein
MKMTPIEKVVIGILVILMSIVFYFGMKLSSAIMRAEAQSSYIRD